MGGFEVNDFLTRLGNRLFPQWVAGDSEGRFECLARLAMAAKIATHGCVSMVRAVMIASPAGYVRAGCDRRRPARERGSLAG